MQQCWLHSYIWMWRNGIFSPPEIHHQLLGLTDVQREVVVVTPVSQGVHLFSVGWFIVIGDQTYHRCVICKFDDDVGAVCGYTVMRVQGEQERAENTTLRGSSVEGQWGGDVTAYSDHLSDLICLEVGGGETWKHSGRGSNSGLESVLHVCCMIYAGKILVRSS